MRILWINTDYNEPWIYTENTMYGSYALNNVTYSTMHKYTGVYEIRSQNIHPVQFRYKKHTQTVPRSCFTMIFFYSQIYPWYSFAMICLHQNIPRGMFKHKQIVAKLYQGVNISNVHFRSYNYQDSGSRPGTSLRVLYNSLRRIRLFSKISNIEEKKSPNGHPFQSTSSWLLNFIDPTGYTGFSVKFELLHWTYLHLKLS